MRTTIQSRTFVSLLLASCLFLTPLSAFAKKGEAHFRKGLQYESGQQWEKAAQEFTLAVAADPANIEYQLHFRRASFNASQAYMQQGRALAEAHDYVAAYNAFRQAYGYDPVNQVSVSEMERMLRLQALKTGTTPPPAGDDSGTPAAPTTLQEPPQSSRGPEQVRVISYSGDLKAFIRQLVDQLGLNVVFDRQSFAQPKVIDLNLKEVTTAQALDYVFMQEMLFFQKLSRRTILVADQTRRAQYQQLVLRTFYLSNIKPEDAQRIISGAIPASVGRPQTIVVADKETNSLTVRDTAENVRLIGELLASLDKDRAEVVMDVNIYEVNKTDMLQIGNQIGTGTFNIGGSPGFSLLTGNAVLSSLKNGVNVAAITGGVPTAMAAALVIPPSVLTAFQSKTHGKLIASTQVHAFNNEESTARIGQRVPVQTASVYGYSGATATPTPGGGVSNGVFGGNGYPVINYEPVGLTLKFTPLVFPNYDVQVKMSIESKDVLNGNTLTPSFTERTITGTARVQNNRTIMLASVSQDIESNGRSGLPVLSGLPIFGRLFTSPTRDIRQVDIVIAVTPRVLRAPALTPQDELMRPSGTLANPTSGSIATVIREAENEEQIAADLEAKRNAAAQTARVEPAPLSAAVVSSASTNLVAGAYDAQSEVASLPQPSSGTPTRVATPNPPLNVTTSVTPMVTPSANTDIAMDETHPYVPAPRSLISTQSATEVAAVNTGSIGAANAVLTSQPKLIAATLEGANSSRIAQLQMATTGEPLKIGEKRRVAFDLKSDVPLGFAVLTLRYDPRVIKVQAVSAGTMLADAKGPTPSISFSADASGICLVSIAGLSGLQTITGTLLFFDIEAVGAGDSGLRFDKGNTNLMATDSREVVVDLRQGQLLVKQ